ncbi:diguanylate cyclase [uncultured Nitratireductor sp.]|uniref:GGDEF domain-containing protein n=1 Tax=uncultured Nitratireductor sp. TaxID=520953 RepID=UPI0025EBC636|nr:sensor domain-containing diguanylate cyclase [uncultured Nitratireductor sp.]
MLTNYQASQKTITGSFVATAQAALLIGVLVFAACLFGIFTRPVDFLATVWPANALMLGLLLRVPATATPYGWLAAACGFTVADLLTGSSLGKTLILTSANLVGVGGAYAVLRTYRPEAIRLQTPEAIPQLVLAIGFGACLAGFVGAVANPILFGGTALGGWTFWFVTEFANFVAILPVILTARWPSLPRRMSWARLARLALPAFALVLTSFASIQIGGPGAVAFPVPALLWAAIVYPRFITVLLTSIFSFWSLIALSANLFSHTIDVSAEGALISMRLGGSLIALAPMMLASAMAKQNDLIGQLSDLARRDSLSGLLNRRAFAEEAEALIRSCARQAKSLAVLMLDIDHFKSINDRFGHAAGDQVISIAAARISACLRGNDIIGRVGGEEFAILLPACSREQALEVAERMRNAFSQSAIALESRGSLTVTVSVGLAWSNNGIADLNALMEEADEALYRAKNLGRNRAEMHLRAHGSRST